MARAHTQHAHTQHAHTHTHVAHTCLEVVSFDAMSEKKSPELINHIGVCMYMTLCQGATMDAGEFVKEEGGYDGLLSIVTSSWSE